MKKRLQGHLQAVHEGRGLILQLLDSVFPRKINQDEVESVVKDSLLPDMRVDRELSYLAEAGYAKSEVYVNPANGQRSIVWGITCAGIDLVEGSIDTERGIRFP